MLAALGVLWDPVERCLVLPLESEALRTVVHQRYVAPGSERVRISLLKEREAFERERNSLWGQADQSHQSTLTTEEETRGGDWCASGRSHGFLFLYTSQRSCGLASPPSPLPAFPKACVVAMRRQRTSSFFFHSLKKRNARSPSGTNKPFDDGCVP